MKWHESSFFSRRFLMAKFRQEELFPRFIQNGITMEWPKALNVIVLGNICQIL